MFMKKVALFLAALICLQASALGAPMNMKVGDKEAKIDFGDSQVSVTPTSPFLAGGLNINQTKIISDDLIGTVSICESTPFEEHSILVSNCDRLLELLMKQANANVDVTAYEEGFFGTGEDIGSGFPTYAILKPIDTEFGRASRLLVIIVSSKNETLSKSIINSATIE